MKSLVLVLVLFLTSLAPLAAQFDAQPGFLNVDRHWKTQVGHGLLTAGTAGIGAAVGELTKDDPTSGAQIGALLMTAFYVVREFGARASYRDELSRGEIDERERSKLVWDSWMDQAYPAYVDLVTFTLEDRAWWWWVGGIVLLHMGNGLDPCPSCYAHGMR